jgi:Flp pilus assembly protein TadG
MVEFALILPILLAIIIGIFQFGAAYNEKNDLNFLANAAARYASVNACAPCNLADAHPIADYVTRTADTAHLRSTTNITFSLPTLPGGATNTGCIGYPLQVKASAPFNWLGVLSGSGLPAGTITLTATVTTRLLEKSDGTLYTPSSTCPF